MKKGFILGFVVATLLSVGLVFGAEMLSNVYISQFPIKLNGEVYNAEMPVLNYQGRTYLALREFGTVTNNEIDFKNNTIIINNNSTQTKQEDNTNDTFVFESNNQKYELTITGVKETKDRNQFSSKTPEQVLLIDYTYKNVSGSDLFISDMNFKLIDEEGFVGYSYPIEYTMPQSIPAGTSCKAQLALGIDNKSSNIVLHYYDNMFNDNSDKVFNLKVD